MLNEEQLKGNEIGWINWGRACYNTNFGQVQLDEKTGEFVECCIGLGRNQGNTQMGITIFDNEFRISKDTFNTIYAELHSKNYPYPANCKQSIEILEVLKMLQKDNNDSVAALIVKKKIVELMYKEFQFGKPELVALHELFRSWRKPIREADCEAQRAPIIQRTPIITRTPIRR